MYSLGFLLALALSSPPTAVVRVEVHASSQGLEGVAVGPDGKVLRPPGPSKVSDLVITCEPNRCVSGDREVPIELVEAVRTAVSQPAMERITLDNLGVGEDWLRRVIAKERSRFEYAKPTPQDAFLGVYGTRLQDCAPRADVMLGMLASYYDPQNWWTDDYPRVTASMTISSGSSVQLSSDSQKEFMLPWKVSVGGEIRTTYDARVSRALTALLPLHLLERERIAGERLGEWYLQQFRYNSPAVCGNGTRTP